MSHYFTGQLNKDIITQIGLKMQNNCIYCIDDMDTTQWIKQHEVMWQQAYYHMKWMLRFQTFLKSSHKNAVQTVQYAVR